MICVDILALEKIFSQHSLFPISNYPTMRHTHISFIYQLPYTNLATVSIFKRNTSVCLSNSLSVCLSVCLSVSLSLYNVTRKADRSQPFFFSSFWCNIHDQYGIHSRVSFVTDLQIHHLYTVVVRIEQEFIWIWNPKVFQDSKAPLFIKCIYSYNMNIDFKFLQER